MNKYILEQLKKTKGLSFFDDNGIQLDLENINSHNEFIIKKSTINTDSFITFTFEDYLINPFKTFDFHINFNNGVNIPLKVMRGKILKEVGKLLYIEVFGIEQDTDKCFHCLKKGKCNSICEKCKEYYNIPINQIYWKGYVPKKSIIYMEN